MRWMDDVEKWAKMSFEKLLKETEDRWRWCTLSMKRPTLGTRMVKDKTVFTSQGNIQRWVGS